MPILTDLNVPPYNDDFNANNNYYRVLYKPSVAVQARELTQSQSILQDQIEKFGDSIYYHGSVVKGGKHNYDQSHYSVYLQDSYANVILIDTVIANSVGMYAIGATSNTINRITAYTLKTTDQPNILLYKPVVGGGGKVNSFQDNEVIQLYMDITTDGSNNVIGANLVANVQAVASNSFGFGSTFFIDESIYYINGTFVRANAQLTVVNTSVLSTNVVVGYAVQENIVTALQDPSLYDNALGSSNYNAPGADRLQINLILTTANSDAVTTNNFVAVATIQNGLIQIDNTTPLYSVIGDSMAKRTFETSGDFTLSQFTLNIKDISTTGNVLYGTISSGTAFVKGYEYSFNNPLSINLQKARTTDSVNDAIVDVFYGNYAKFTNLTGKTPDINTGMPVELHYVGAGSVSSSTKIGTANIRNIDYESNTGANTTYAISLFNINITNTAANAGFANTRSIIVANATGGYTGVRFSANIAYSGQVDGNGTNFSTANAILYDTSYNTLIFPIGEKNIASTNNVGYTFRRKHATVSFTNGVGVINTVNSGESFLGNIDGVSAMPSSQAVAEYSVVITSGSGSVVSNGQFVPLDLLSRTVTVSSFSTQASIDIKDATFNGTADIIATIAVSNESRKSKTLVSAAVVNTGSIAPGSSVSLNVCDIYALDAVYDIANGAYRGAYSNATTYALNDTVISNAVIYTSKQASNLNKDVANTTWWTPANNNIIFNFTYDNGQRDAFYDFGSVTYNGASSTGNTVIVFDYFTHSGGKGFLSVNSYPVDYGSIPAYTTSTGNILQLRDCYDFRPRRTDNSSNTSYVFDSYQVPIKDPSQFLRSDHSYYLKRIDKIILNKDGKFIVKSGIPAYITPQYPSDDPDGLTMFILSYPAYTYHASDVIIQSIPHKRYTMQDIGSLDQRLSSVEYYTALTMGEQQLMAGTIASNSGTTLFKNGFLVDAFAGHSVGDVANPDYKCSIDYTKNILRPSINAASIQFDTSNTSNVAVSNTIYTTNNHLMLQWSEKPFIVQNFITDLDDQLPNPVKFRSYHGKIKLKIDRDCWFDDKHMPEVYQNDNDSNNNWIKKAPANTSDKGAFGTEYDFHHTLFLGVDKSSTIQHNVNKSTPVNVSQSKDQTLAILKTNYTNLQLSGANNTVLANAYAAILNYNSSSSQSTTITTSNTSVSQFNPPGDPRSSTQITTDNRIKNTCVVFHARRLEIEFEAYGLAPLTKHHVFISGLLVSGHCRNWNWGTNAFDTRGIDLYTDRHGRLKGEFTIPNMDDFKFKAKEYILIEITDNFKGVRGSTSYAAKKFWIRGKPDRDDDIVIPFPSSPLFFNNDGSVITASIDTPPSGKTHIRIEDQSGYDTDDNLLSSCKLIDLIELQRQISFEFSLFGESYSVLVSDISSIYTIFVNRLKRPPCIGEHIYHLRRLYKSYKTLTDIDNEMLDYYNAYHFNSNNIVSGVSSASASPIKTYNPLATTIYVDPAVYKNGVYITSVDLCISELDDYEPIHLHLRPCDNDRPHESKEIHHSHVWRHPHECKKHKFDDDINTRTKFTFDHPVYLAPGEKFALVLSSNSPKYICRGAGIGKVDKISGKKIYRPFYCGPMYKPNLTRWDPDDTMMFTFTVNQAVFNPTATISFPLKTLSGTMDYNTFCLTTDEETVSGVTSVKYEYQPKIASSNTLGSFTTVIPNENTTYSTGMIVNQSSTTEGYGKLTLTTTDTNISPVVNLPKLSGVFVGNMISANSGAYAETLPVGGGALAKYVTKPVTLTSSISATSLRVWLDLNLQGSTSVEVYYKILNNYDGSAFSSLPWVKMDNPTLQYVSNETDFIEHAWSKDNISYTNGNSTYPNFNVFAIKVVMYSSNPAIVPKCQNLRVVAAS